MSRYVPSRSKPTLHLSNRLGLDWVYSCRAAVLGEIPTDSLRDPILRSFMQNLHQSRANRTETQNNTNNCCRLPNSEIKPVCIRCLTRNQVAWQAHQYQQTCNQAHLLQSWPLKYTISAAAPPCLIIQECAYTVHTIRRVLSYGNRPPSVRHNKGGFLANNCNQLLAPTRNAVGWFQQTEPELEFRGFSFPNCHLQVQHRSVPPAWQSIGVSRISQWLSGARPIRRNLFLNHKQAVSF